MVFDALFFRGVPLDFRGFPLRIRGFRLKIRVFRAGNSSFPCLKFVVSRLKIRVSPRLGGIWRNPFSDVLLEIRGVPLEIRGFRLEFRGVPLGFRLLVEFFLFLLSPVCFHGQAAPKTCFHGQTAPKTGQHRELVYNRRSS